MTALRDSENPPRVRQRLVRRMQAPHQHADEGLVEQVLINLIKNAMQAFDEIITRQAHSGVVLDALKYSVVCADKLGMKAKSDQYRSLLRDVFQVGT